MSEKERDVWSVFRPHYPKIALIVILQIVGVVAQIFAITLLKPMLDIGLKDGDLDSLLLLGIYLLIATVLASIVMALTSYMASHISSKVASDLRDDLMDSVLRTNNLQSLTGTTTRAMTSLTDDVNFVQEYVYVSLATYLPMPFLLAFLLALTAMTSYVTGILIAVTMALVFLLTYYYTRRISHVYVIQQTRMDRVNSLFRQKIGGARTIRSYDGFEYEREKFNKESASFGKANRTVGLNSYFVPQISTAIMWMLMILIFLSSLMMDLNGTKIHPADVVMFMQYVTYFVATMTIIPYILISIPKARSHYGRLIRIIHKGKETGTYSGPDDTSDKAVLRVSGLNTTDNRGMVSLKDIELDVRKGEILSIVGPNGSGGSEIFSVALGFRTPESGTVRVCGMDVSETEPSSIRERVSYVSSGTHILRGTLRYNLDPHGSNDDARILEVCDRVGLGRYISSLPEGLDTEITGDEIPMSGGQKQMVAIARCLLKKADIRVFDNCFFSVDYTTRAGLIPYIIKECSDSSLVFILHDTSTCRYSDSIVLMDSGSIIDKGSHEELLNRSETYRGLDGVDKEGTSWAC